MRSAPFCDRGLPRATLVRLPSASLGGHDHVVNGNVARVHGISGFSCPSLWSWLEEEVAYGDLRWGSRDYPNPATFLYMVSRAVNDTRYVLNIEAHRRLREELDSRLC